MIFKLWRWEFVILNAHFGFDVLAISFASPAIAIEWKVNRAELRMIPAMELIAMAIFILFKLVNVGAQFIE